MVKIMTMARFFLTARRPAASDRRELDGTEPLVKDAATAASATSAAPAVATGGRRADWGLRPRLDRASLALQRDHTWRFRIVLHLAFDAHSRRVGKCFRSHVLGGRGAGDGRSYAGIACPV